MAQGHLEKSPLVRPVRHVPSGATPRSFLNFDERQILVRTLNVLVAYVNSNLEELFKVNYRSCDSPPHFFPLAYATSRDA